MSEKNFTRLFGVITLILVISFFTLASIAQADTEQSWLDKEKESMQKNWQETKDAFSTDWSWSKGGRFTYKLKNEWEDIKEFQRHSWSEGKEQHQKNIDNIKGYWQTLADALGQIKN